MDYYQLQYEAGGSIGKTFPQSQETVSEVNINAPHHLLRVEGKFPADVYIPEPVLHRQANVTDLISSAAIRYPIVSSKLKAILERARSEGVEFWPTNLITKKGKLKYWIMNGYQKDFKYVDFTKSEIVLNNQHEKSSKRLELSTHQGFEMALESIHYPETIMINKLSLIDTINDDLFFLAKVKGSKHFVSERLKTTIEEAGCTGIEFQKHIPR